MADNKDIKNYAGQIFEHFDFDFGDSGMEIVISSAAPPEILDMVIKVCGSTDQECLVQIYEALGTLIESDDVECSEIDEKVCEIGIYCNLLDWLKKN
ncbi:hypothetical protein [Maridesulfovibrio bastinii]|jgi:hypothetical protein|uniref:hypothetical protein n=1 Tax=Maridesulfovibrio bastinii TaxID=47157 RepID=UPI00040317A9|nr:hypothetical protein [Maridesulfovibrio bastinii]